MSKYKSFLSRFQTVLNVSVPLSLCLVICYFLPEWVTAAILMYDLLILIILVVKVR